MSHATFSLPHVFPSSSRPRHMNNPSAQHFQGYHSDSSSLPQSTHQASAAAPGAQRTLPYLLATRGPSSSSFNFRKPNPVGFSPLSSSSSFSTKSRGSSTRMAAPATETQLQVGQTGGSVAASVMHRKSRATCTLSLAHVSASAMRPSVSTSSTTSSVAPAGSSSTASTADQGSNSGSDEGSGVINEERLDQAQAQALKDAVIDAPVHMCVGVDGPFPRVEVEVETSSSTLSREEFTVFSEPEDVTTTAKSTPIAIPSKLPIRTKKSLKSMAAKKRQSEVNIIPFPSSEASPSFAGYMQERYNHERSGSISSSYSSTSSRSFSSSSSSGSSSSSTSVTSSSSSPPHVLLRTSPPLTFKPLPKRSRRASNASIQPAQHPSPAALSIDTSTTTTIGSTSAAAVVDDRDPPSPSSPRSSTSSCTLIESDDGSDSTPLSPVKSDLKAKSTLALTMETTPPPPPYSLLPPPYSPLTKGSDAKDATGSIQSPRPRRPLPELPTRASVSLPAAAAEVRVAEEVSPIPAEVSVIHAPVPRAAFVRIEGGNAVPNAEGGGDKGLVSGSQPGGSVVSLPPISPPAQPPRIRTTSRTAVSGSSSSAKATTSTSRRSRISTGELKVLLYLYRTVVFGLESRYRLEGERSHSPSMFMDQKASSPRFPLVEEDEDSDKNTQTPHSSPSTSPSAPSCFPAVRFDPSSCGCPSSASSAGSCPSPSMQAFKEARQRAKAKQAADNAMDVQDALLAIRLRGLLRAQGVPEADLDLRINSKTQRGDGKDPRSTIVVEDDGGAEDLDPFAEFGTVELDSASDSSDTGRSSVPARPFKASPPPLSRSSSSGKAVISPSAAYMIALLTMRYRYASPSRRHRLTSGTMKNGAHAGGRKSKLNIAAWAASPDGGIIEQEEADFDSCSVVDWYI